MKRTRRQFTGEEKVALLRRHLVEQVAVSQVCEEATQFLLQQKLLYEEWVLLTLNVNFTGHCTPARVGQQRIPTRDFREKHFAKPQKPQKPPVWRKIMGLSTLETEEKRQLDLLLARSRGESRLDSYAGRW